MCSFNNMNYPIRMTKLKLGCGCAGPGLRFRVPMDKLIESIRVLS
jgi:hypothetical protein